MIGEKRETDPFCIVAIRGFHYRALVFQTIGESLQRWLCYDYRMGTARRDNPDRLGFYNVPMRYPNEYVWLVFVSAMDIIFTLIFLSTFDGRETNPIADLYLQLHGKTGLIVFKFGIIVLVVVACEVVGRSKDRTGRRLARIGVGISALPLLVSFFLMMNLLLEYFTGAA